MKLIIGLCLINIMLFLSACGTSNSVSEEDQKAILNFIAESDKAFNSKQLNRFLLPFNKDTVFKFSDGEDLLKVGYVEFERVVSHLIMEITIQEGVRKNEKVRIGKSGRIIYEADKLTKHRIDGNNLEGKSHEVWEFIKTEDAYKVISLTII